MTINEAQSAVIDISNKRDDDEAAHGMEDKLYVGVLRTLADEGSVLAAVALQTQGIHFERWCA